MTIRTEPDQALSNVIRAVVDAVLEKDGEKFVKEAIEDIIADIIKKSIKAKVEKAIVSNQTDHPDMMAWCVELARELRGGSAGPPPPFPAPSVLIE